MISLFLESSLSIIERKICEVRSVMNYEEALSYIENTQKFGSILGLERIAKLLEMMGNPQKKLKFIHVAGTNGKGSTCAFMQSVLTQAGYKVGMYTSPSFLRFTDRIRIGKEEMDEDRMAEIMTRIKYNIDEMVLSGLQSPTEFEIITALGLVYFYEESCDLVILEVGLGGRLDSTNVIDAPLVSVITPIDYDHMDILGSTLEEIAGEKAGILKAGSELVLYPQKKEAEKVILKKAEELQIPVHRVSFRDSRVLKFDGLYQRFSYEGEEYRLSILGEHQVKNAVVAIEALYALEKHGFRVPHETLVRGLSVAKWPGRFEILQNEPTVIIDGAHNLQGVQVLKSNLMKYYRGKKITMILGVLKDKMYREMIRELLPLAKNFKLITVNSERALSAEMISEEIRKVEEEIHEESAAKEASQKKKRKKEFDFEEVSYVKKECFSTVVEAVDSALHEAEPDDIICALGSLYYIPEVHRYFGDED